MPRPYFDLAASCSGCRLPEAGQDPAAPARRRLANRISGDWFRTPLAVKFERSRWKGDQSQHVRARAASVRHAGRCWRGCDRQAKNTLDLNYLARAEQGSPPPDIRTLAEVTKIARGDKRRFQVN